MKNNKRRSRKRELQAAKDIGGYATIASGGLWFDKGDIKNDKFLIEDKFTDADKYSIKLSILNKIEKEADKAQKIPIFRFGFENRKEDYVVVDPNLLIEEKNIYDTAKLRITSAEGKKSLSLKANTLKDLRLSGSDYILNININNKEFMILTWSLFLEIADNFIL